MGVKGLHIAKQRKDDELYTLYNDVAAGIKKIQCGVWEGKNVYCNCDSEHSNFWKFFHLNFEFLGLKSLVATHCDKNNSTYKITYQGGNDIDMHAGEIMPLRGNGDFRSPECVDLLQAADIVVTNPPFSLFREYVGLLIKNKKKFLIMGDMNAVTYKVVFPYLKNNSILCWMGGQKGNSYFKAPDGRIARLRRVYWYTNLDVKKHHEPLDLIEKYTPEKYPKYDNYDAINVDKTLDIPVDYDGVMGVPISFMGKYCPEQFEIVGMAEDNGHGYSGCAAKWDGKNPHCIIDGKIKFKRIFIRYKRKITSYP